MSHYFKKNMPRLNGYPAPRYPSQRDLSKADLLKRVKEYIIFPKSRAWKDQSYIEIPNFPIHDWSKSDRVLLVWATEFDAEVGLAYAQALREVCGQVDVFYVTLGNNAPENVASIEATTLVPGEDNFAYSTFCNLIYNTTARALIEEKNYNIIMSGTAGPTPHNVSAKWLRTPFITREEIASHQIELPMEVQLLIERKLDQQIMNMEEGRLTDPEGTDITWTNYNDSRPKYMSHQFGKPINIGFGGDADCTGIVAGTINHMGAFPKIKATLKNDLVVKVEGGGSFGQVWREKISELNAIQLPALPIHSKNKSYSLPGPGFFWFWEMAIATFPGVFRLRRESRFECFANFLHDRLRAGYVHMGFGPPTPGIAILTKMGIPWTHVHVHSLFATIEGKSSSGESFKIIDKGHLTVLDDPEIRRLAAKLGSEDLLKEVWIPAIPGINADGDYEKYAEDPIPWIRQEAEKLPEANLLYR